MADTKISALSSLTAPSSSDVLAIVNGGATKKITVQNLSRFPSYVYAYYGSSGYSVLGGTGLDFYNTIGAITVNINAFPTDNNVAAIRFFRSTNTTAAVSLQVMTGDNTATPNHLLYGKAGTSNLCYNNGALQFGSGTNTTCNITHFGYYLQFLTDAATSTAPLIEAYYHRTSGTPAAGFGITHYTYLNTNGGTDRLAYGFSALWINATDATRTSHAIWSLTNSASSLTEYMRLTPQYLKHTHIYGSCYGVDIAWVQASAVQNTWYPVSDADISDGQLNQVTHDGSGKLTLAVAGKYLINYNVTVESSAASKYIEAGIGYTTSGGSISVQNDGRSRELNAAAEGNLSGTCILNCGANSTIEICVRTTDTGTPNITVDHCNLTVTYISY